jgi:hypothetical protein
MALYVRKREQGTHPFPYRTAKKQKQESNLRPHRALRPDSQREKGKKSVAKGECEA